MLLGLAGIFFGDASDGDPNEKAGSVSPSPATRSLDWLLISIALSGRRPEALEKEEGADLEAVEGGGDGALAGKTKLGSGSGPGLFSRGDGGGCKTLSTIVVRKGPLPRSNPLNDILPGEVAVAILSLPHGGQCQRLARLRA
jgi:hypothetical protein